MFVGQYKSIYVYVSNEFVLTPTVLGMSSFPCVDISAHSAVAVEYTDRISVEGQDSSPNKCPGYDIKPSDGEAPVLEIWECGVPLSLPLLARPPWIRVIVPGRFHQWVK